MRGDRLSRRHPCGDQRSESATDCEPLLKGTVLTLRNLYRFDSKLTSIVVRLQGRASAQCWRACESTSTALTRSCCRLS